MNLGRYIPKDPVGQTTVSQEGALTFLKKLFARPKSDPEKRSSRLINYDAMFKDLRATYANPDWLEHHPSVEGNINAAGIAEFCILDGKVGHPPYGAVVPAVKALEDFTKAYVHNLQEFVQSIEGISERFRSLTNTDNPLEVAKEVAKKLDDLPRPLGNLKLNSAIIPGHPEIRIASPNYRDSVEYFHPSNKDNALTELPALSKSEVLECAKLTIQVLEQAVLLQKEWTSVRRPSEELLDHLYMNIERRGSDEEMAGADHMVNYLYPVTFSENYIWCIGDMEKSVVNMARGLERWMHRSIK